MIYNYYCVNCGNENKGEEISFDLSELVGVRSDSDGSKPDPLAMVTSGVLRANANMNGVTLKHGVVSKIRIPLKIYLGILGHNNDGRNGIGAQQMREFSYNELDEALEQIYMSNENKEAAAANISKLATAIRNQFTYDGSDDPADNDDTDHYYAEIFIKPIFFENGRSEKIYTIEFARSELDPNTIPIRVSGQPIRGYCPKCGRAIILNAGVYPHVLVGLLGAQSAGKTTMILALINEIFKSYKQCGIMLENTILSDDSYANVQRDKNLFDRGWPPMKTNKDGANSFNASMVLESSITHQKKIVTFADIAGEKCYDMAHDNVDLDALRSFPLINSCDVYLLCTCIDQTAYGNTTTDTVYLPPQAVLKIARGIYDHLKNPKKVPPLCVVLTKADVTPTDGYASSAENPFTEIKPRHEHLYQYMTQFTNLSNTYDIVDNEDIRTPLEWCCTTYDQMREKTYVSMMSCSALGRNATPYDGSMDNIPMCPDKAFRPINVNHLLKWVLQTVGLSPIESPLTGGRPYFFPRVPSYEEYYRRVNASGAAQDSQEYYTIDKAVPRCGAIPSMFLNPTALDNKIFGTTKKPELPKKKRRGLLSFFETEEVEERPSVQQIIDSANHLIN